MKTKTNKNWVAAFASTLFILSACSSTPNGASDAANTRSLIGNTSSTASAELSTSLFSRAAFAAVSAADCAADGIIATDVTGATQTSTVDDACDFAIDLEVDTSYVISLTQDGSFIATLIFDTGVTGFTGSSLSLSDGTGTIDLGWITINGAVATPENNPLSYNDNDGDGENDLIDNDDDNDGIYDFEERDCDLDGFLDDDDDEYDDDHSDSCTATEGEFVTRVKPYNEGEGVDLDKEVKIYTTCSVDADSVSDATLAVVAESGEAIACTFEFSSDSEHNSVKCKHEDAPFVADTIYTVTVDGLLCEDGSPIQAVEWSFSTELSDDDDGDYEDDYDDEDALEGEDTEDHLEDESDDDSDALETGDDEEDVTSDEEENAL